MENENDFLIRFNIAGYVFGILSCLGLTLVGNFQVNYLLGVNFFHKDKKT